MSEFQTSRKVKRCANEFLENKTTKKALIVISVLNTGTSREYISLTPAKRHHSKI